MNNIYIVQDCDADGLFSSVLAYKFLDLITNPTKIEILYHTDKRHGLTPEIMEQIKPNSFVWIPDAGSNDVEQCKELSERGCKILITDHHNIERENPYAVVINNQREGIENKAGSGTLVTFKFIEYCCKKLGITFYLNWVDIVAFANIGDVMPMTTVENRTFNYIGLRNIKTPFLKYLCDALVKDEVTPVSVAWDIIPKINATIRAFSLGYMKQLTKALISNEMDEAFFEECLESLRRCHKDQGSLTSEKSQRLLEDIDDSNNVIVAFSESSPYNGLIANKILSAKNKPVLLVHEEDGNYIGSYRGPFDARDVMSESGLFNFASGHQKACGVSFPVENTNKIVALFNQFDVSEFQWYKVIGSFKPVNLPDFLFEFNTKYNTLWGTDVPEPTVHVHINCNGMNWQEMKGNTIKLKVDGVTFIKFFVSKNQKEQWHIGKNIQLSIDIIGKCCYNEWQGNRYKQVVIETMESIEKPTDWSELF